jgi:hypothetical protein
LLIDLNQKGVRPDRGEQVLLAGEEGGAELDAAVLIVALLDQDEGMVEGGAEQVDVFEGVEGRRLEPLYGYKGGMLPAVQGLLEGAHVGSLSAFMSGGDLCFAHARFANA